MQVIQLEKLSEAAYGFFMSELETRYVADRMESNRLTEKDAMAFTKKQWSTFIPQGQRTPGHYFFDLVVSETAAVVGKSWLFVDAENFSAFIFELALEPDARGKGLGRASLQALEAFSKNQGAKTLGLNVFAANDRARSLYDSFGFQAVSTDMIKPL